MHETPNQPLKFRTLNSKPWVWVPCLAVGFYYQGVSVCLRGIPEGTSEIDSQVLMGEDGDKVKPGEVVELLQDPIFFWSKKHHHGLDAGGKYRFIPVYPEN